MIRAAGDWPAVSDGKRVQVSTSGLVFSGGDFLRSVLLGFSHFSWTASFNIDANRGCASLVLRSMFYAL